MASSTGWFPIYFLLRDSENDLLRNQTERCTGFVPFFEQKIQGLFKDPSYFSRTPFSKKKSLESMSFLVLLQHEQLCREGLSVFAPLGTWESGLDKISTEIHGLSSTDCNFSCTFKAVNFYFKIQGLSRCVRTLDPSAEVDRSDCNLRLV